MASGKGNRKKLTLRDVGSMVEHVVKHMATKEDVADLQGTLNEHTKILNEHTRDFNVIKNDMKTNLDQRKQLEVRVTRLEKKVGV